MTKPVPVADCHHRQPVFITTLSDGLDLRAKFLYVLPYKTGSYCAEFYAGMLAFTE